MQNAHQYGSIGKNCDQGQASVWMWTRKHTQASEAVPKTLRVSMIRVVMQDKHQSSVQR